MLESFLIVQAMMDLSSIDVEQRDMVLLPPDKANNGQWGNHMSLWRTFLAGGQVQASVDLTSAVCYETIVFMMGGQVPSYYDYIRAYSSV